MRSAPLLGGALLGALFTAGSCRDSEPAPTPLPLQEVVRCSTSAMTEFSATIAGDLIEVEYPLPAEADPARWTAERSVVEEFQRARLIVFSGAGYETWARQATLPGSRRVDTADGFETRWITREEKTHSHGDGPAHTHASIDPYVWLDPQLAKQQAQAIHQALSRLFPEEAPRLDRGLAELRGVLDEIEQQLEGLVPEGRVVISTHPSFAYLARHCAWRHQEVDLDPDAAVAEQPWSELDAARAGADAVLLFDRPVPAALRQACEQRGYAVVEWDTVERPAAGSYRERMQANLDRLRAAVGG